MLNASACVANCMCSMEFDSFWSLLPAAPPGPCIWVMTTDADVEGNGKNLLFSSSKINFRALLPIFLRSICGGFETFAVLLPLAVFATIPLVYLRLTPLYTPIYIQFSRQAMLMLSDTGARR